MSSGFTTRIQGQESFLLKVRGVEAAVTRTGGMLGPVTFFTFDLLGALCWGVLTAIYIWVLLMLWNVKPQAWLFVLVVAGINLFLAFLSILGASSFQAMLPAILINGLILVYCLLPGTKQAFGVPS